MGISQTNRPTNRWRQVGMILVVVLLVLLYAGPYRYAIGPNRFWLCVFSLWFDSQCCVGVVSGFVVVSCRVS